MLISDQSKQVAQRYAVRRYVLIGTAVLMLLFMGLRLMVPYWGQSRKGLIVCDAEYTRGDLFVTRGYVFKNGQTQSGERARSGGFSSITGADSPKGMAYILRAPKSGQRYRVSVYRSQRVGSNGSLVVQDSKNDRIIKQETIASGQASKGWERLQLTFVVPEEVGNSIEIFVTSTGATPVFFDDLSIEQVGQPQVSASASAYKPAPFHLKIGAQAMQQLRAKRDDALSLGMLLTDEADWVSAEVDNKQQKLDVDVRLKGNRLYHLQGDKWSFKVHVDDPYAWNGMQTFSLQNPAVHHFLQEWVYHQLLLREGVMAARYDFIQLQLNNRDYGVYAYEENPDWQLPAHLKRPDGPIVRFSEASFRYKQLLKGSDAVASPVPVLDAAEIVPYKAQSTAQDPQRLKAFQLAQRLMHQYKYNLQPPKAIFDLDALAKFYAISDVMNAYQSIKWHNQRFYCNPVTSKLEPVAISGVDWELKPYRNRTFIGEWLYSDMSSDAQLYMHLFSDADFMERYAYYLRRYSDKEFLSSFLLDIERELLNRQQFLRKEYTDYAFDPAVIYKKAQQIQQQITPIPDISVQAKIEKRSGSRIEVKVANFHSLPVRVVGFGSAAQLTDTVAQAALLACHYAGLPPVYATYSAARSATHLYYKVAGDEALQRTELSLWNAPEMGVPAQYVFEQAQIRTNPLYDVRGSLILFKAGKYNVNASIIIPAGFEVNIPAGTELNFRNSAKFISQSPVHTFGTPAQPVIFDSPKGILLLNTGIPSEWQHTLVRKAQNLDYDEWWLPGAMTVYNAPLYLEQCTFAECKAPEALSVYHTKVHTSGLQLHHNRERGLVLRQAEGMLDQIHALDNPIAGIDIRQSKAKIHNTTLTQCRDNGLMVGENADVEVGVLRVSETDIGIISRDRSKLRIEQAILSDCQRGFAAYQKLPEYGGSQIVVKDFEAQGVTVLHRIELGSLLNLKGKEIKGY